MERDIKPFIQELGKVEHIKKIQRSNEEKEIEAKVRILNREREWARNQGFKRGYQEGFDKGFEEGKSDLINSYQEKIDHFSAALSKKIQEVDHLVESWYEKSAEQLAPLSLAIAEKLIGMELEIKRDSVVPIARNAIQEATLGRTIKIRLNPCDVPLLEEKKEEILHAVSHIAHLEVFSDPNVKSGCLVETESGVIDARVHQMLERLVEAARKST